MLLILLAFKHILDTTTKWDENKQKTATGRPHSPHGFRPMGTLKKLFYELFGQIIMLRQ